MKKVFGCTNIQCCALGAARVKDEFILKQRLQMMRRMEEEGEGQEEEEQGGKRTHELGTLHGSRACLASIYQTS